MKDPTEIPDGENTVPFTNLLEPLNLLRRECVVGMKMNVSSVVIKT